MGSFEEEYSEEDDFEQVIEDEWCQYLYENSMGGLEVINKLNEQDEKNEKILYFITEFQNKIDDDEKKGILQIPNHIVSHMLYSIKKVIE